jgi:ketosteroid isomerase-like protein
MKHGLWLAVVVVCVVSWGCQPAAGLSEQDKAAIQKLHGDYAQAMNAQKLDAAALVKAYYAPDAKVLMPNMPAVLGQEAIIKGTAMGGPAKNFKLDGVVVDGRGDLAYAQGAYEGDWALPSGEPAHDKGKFLETLKKQADGTWKVAFDIWNSDLPVPGLVVPTAALKADASAELKNLGWFAGTWQMNVDGKESPFGPAGKSSTIMDCRWFTSGQQLFCKNDGTTPGGPYHEVFIMSYDAESKAYKGYDVDTSGVTSQFGMAFKDNVWTLNYDMKMGGKPLKMRATLSDLTKDGCSIKQEVSTGGAWTTIVDGKVKKIAG